MPVVAATSSAPARSSARLAAIQGLYQMDIAGTDLNDVIGQRLTDGLAAAALDPDDDDVDEAATAVPPAPRDMGIEATPPDTELMTEILRGVMANQRTIDQAIDQQLAEGWRLARIDATVRAILRAGAYELMRLQEIPARVVISEYVDIAHAFFAGDEPKVVNGVVDALARKYRAQEF